MVKNIFDLRVIVAVCGIALSVLMHELFHIIIHWTELESVQLFPDSEAIIEIVFTPSVEYNLAVEEAFAYAVTMITLLLTAMLINDINDLRPRRPADTSVLAKDFTGCYAPETEHQAHKHLSSLLGIQHTS